MIEKQGDGPVLSSGATAYARHNLTISSEAGIDAGKANIIAGDKAQLSARQDINNGKGRIEAGEIKLEAAGLNNQDGGIYQQSTRATAIKIIGQIENNNGEIISNGEQMEILAGKMANQTGKILHAGHGEFNLATSAALDNTAGQLQSNGNLTIDAGEINNQGGMLIAVEDLSITAQHDLQNNQGKIAGGGNGQLSVGSTLDNGEGSITVNQGLKIKANSLQNDKDGAVAAYGQSGLTVEIKKTLQNQGNLVSAGSTVINADNLVNKEGRISGEQEMRLEIGDLTNSGQISAGQNLAITAKRTIEQRGTVAAGNNVDITADKITATGSIGAGVQSDGNLGDAGNLTIYAGKEGFDITVGKNTDLRGAVIASEATANKNKISTETLTYEDIENKAEYSAESSGINVNISQQDKTQKDGTTKTETVTKPGIDLGTPVEGQADSTTKSAIAEGTIEVRSEKNKDLSDLSRNTENALDKLGQIFDKEEIKEKQELTKLFNQEAFKAIGDLALQQYKKALEKAAKYEKGMPEYEKAMKEAKKWDEGGQYKTMLHQVVGGIAAELAGGNFKEGSSAAGLNEIFQKELGKITDNTLHQIASALIGMSIGKVMGEDGKIGAAIALDATKYNWLTHHQQVIFTKELEEAKGDRNKQLEILAKYAKLSAVNIEKGIGPNGEEYQGEIMEQAVIDALGQLKWGDIEGFVFGYNFEVNENVGMNQNILDAEAFLAMGKNASGIGKNYIISAADESIGKLIIDQMRTSYMVGSTSYPKLGPATTLMLKVDTTGTGTVILKNVQKYGGGVIS